MITIANPEKYVAGLYERITMENEWDKKDAYEDGLKKGEEKGVKRGKAEGKKEGAKENTIKIAKEMLKMNADIDFISKATSLPKEEIEKLM